MSRNVGRNNDDSVNDPTNISEAEWARRQAEVELRSRASGCLLIGFIFLFIGAIFSIYLFTLQLWRG